MKKISIYFICVLSIFCFASCDFNAPLRNKMLNYYSQDDKYLELEGTIVSTIIREDYNELFLEVELKREHSKFPCNADTGYNEFVLVFWSEQKYDLNVGDNIIFTSAPMYFYNGHYLPIVHIEKDEKEYLSFEVGKQNYLKWIEETFK